MPPIICFIRGINVGGRNKIKMADLRELLQSLGMQQPRTVLQSGNAVFLADDARLADLTVRIETSIKRAFGFYARVLLLSADDFRKVCTGHRFDPAMLDQPAKCIIVFLDGAPDASKLADLRAGNPGRETVAADGQTLYIYYADGQARSKLTNARIEATLGLSATARNWNTCQRLLRLLDDLAPHPTAAT